MKNLFRMTSKSLLCAGLLAAAIIGGATHAIGDVVATVPLDNQVTIPWGAWVGDIAVFIASCAASIIALAFRELPAEWTAIAKTARIDQLLEKAIQYGANTVENATLNKEMTVPVANDVIEQALEYAIAHGPGTLLAWVGGKDMLRQKIIARLDIVGAGAVAG